MSTWALYLMFVAVLLVAITNGVQEDFPTNDVPHFTIMSNLADISDPKTNIPDIEVRFSNGNKDRMKLKHITIMPHSKDLDHSKLCNYIGFMEKDKAESVVAVTGCLSRKTPDEKMMITMFSKNSPFHNYFSLDLDGNVQSISTDKYRAGAVGSSSDFIGGIRDANDPGATENPNLDDEIFDEELEEAAGNVAGNIQELVPQEIKINLRMGVDTSAKSGIEGLGQTVDNWLSDLLTHLQVHYLHSSLNHNINFEVTEPTILHNAVLIMDGDGVGLAETVTLVQNLNEPSVDLYAWITDTRDGSGVAGMAYVGRACDNSAWQKTSINSGPTVSWSGSIIVTANTLAHEIGHNLGMSHDFDGNAEDETCRKVSNGDLVSCPLCDNWFNASYVFYASAQDTSYRKLSPETGSAGDCCTGIMDYGNRPEGWSTCSVRFFEQHYEAESWFQCMADVVPSFDSCCDRVEVSATGGFEITGNGQLILGTYDKQCDIVSGRVAYFKEHPSTNVSLFWHTGLDMWLFGPDPATTSSYVKHETCTGDTGFCPSGCSSNWKAYDGSSYVLDTTFKVECSVNSASPVGLQQTCDQINYLGNEVSNKMHCCMTSAGDNYICVDDDVASEHGFNPNLVNCITCPTAIEQNVGAPDEDIQQTCDQINYLGNEITSQIHCCITSSGNNLICVSDASAISNGLNPSLTTCPTCPSGIETNFPPTGTTVQETCDHINYVGDGVSNKIHCCMTTAGDNFICVNDADAASGGLNANLGTCTTCPAAIEENYAGGPPSCAATTSTSKTLLWPTDPTATTTTTTTTTTPSAVANVQDDDGNDCKNDWTRLKCAIKLSLGKCREDRVWSHCKVTCQHCCGDAWPKWRCERTKWACNKGKTVKRNCRKTCNKC